jgi:hypothetical protein
LKNLSSAVHQNGLLMTYVPCRHGVLQRRPVELDLVRDAIDDDAIRGGSPIFVPPNFTISAVTPDFFPSSLTAWMNAGGNENSRPHSNPTTSGPLELFARAFAMTSPGSTEFAPFQTRIAAGRVS